MWMRVPWSTEMSLAPAVYLVGIGGFSGFFIGYALRKILKILAIAIGVFFLAVISLGYVGAVVINHDGLVEFVSKLLDPNQAAEVLMPLITNFPLVASFTVGFLVGLKKG